MTTAVPDLTPDVVVHAHLRDRLTHLRRLADDVVAELALTVYWAHREGTSVDDIAALVQWPVEAVRAALARTCLDPDVDALIAEGPELDWLAYQRAPFGVPEPVAPDDVMPGRVDTDTGGG
jgi:hypothetical protein